MVNYQQGNLSNVKCFYLVVEFDFLLWYINENMFNEELIMSKNDVIVNRNEIEKIKKLREEKKKNEHLQQIELNKKIEEARKKDIESSTFNQQTNVLQKLTGEKHKNTINDSSLLHHFKGNIFNVGKNEDENKTYFIVSVNQYNKLFDYYIVGTDNDINGRNFSETYDFKIYDKSSIYINDVKYEIYNENNPDHKNKNKKTEESVMEVSDNWIENLSFYKKGLFGKIKNKKLNSDEIEELISVIKKDNILTKTQIFLYVEKITNMKSIRLNDVIKLEATIEKELTGKKKDKV